MSTKLFIEGGSSNSDSGARRGFSEFLAKSDLNTFRKLPRIVVCGSRNDAMRDYVNRGDDTGLLLVDSEGPVADLKTKKQHLQDRTGDKRSDAMKVREEDLFFMVETMESWLIADIESIGAAAKQSEVQKAVARRTACSGNVQKISKSDAEALVQNCLPDRQSKGKRMELMGKLDFNKVAQSAPELAALVGRLKEL